jgi:hypothetical protein
VTRTSLPIDQIVTMLAETPRRIAALTDDLTPGQLRTNPGPDEWSTNDVLAHLRSCADMWGGAIVTILAEDHPTIRAVNPRTWIKQTDYPNEEFGPSLRAFATQRADLMAMLESLPREGWSRAATVTGAGAPLERTVRIYAQWLARHERPHIRQIERIASRIRT